MEEEDMLSIRTAYFMLFENIQNSNQPPSVLKGLKILNKLLTNLKANPNEEKFRTIKTTNEAIKNFLLNLKEIDILLDQIGFVINEESNYFFYGDDFTNIDVCLGILNQLINELENKNYEKSLGEGVAFNAEVVKEKEKIQKKMEEEKKRQEDINRLIEEDKEERKIKFNYGDNKSGKVYKNPDFLQERKNMYRNHGNKNYKAGMVGSNRNAVPPKRTSNNYNNYNQYKRSNPYNPGPPVNRRVMGMGDIQPAFNCNSGG